MNLCLTIDYELHGDGSGNVFDVMIRPMDKFLTLCASFEIKSTIFFEVIEYLVIKQHWEADQKMGYKENPVTAIEKQLIRAYREGHDIQLHIHPQWINAKYNESGWYLDKRYWRLPNVPTNRTEQFPMSLMELISKGKSTIESLIQKIDPSYTCNIFRAGGFNIWPSHEIIPVLKTLGFVADSSVFYYGFANSDLSSFDYSNISHEMAIWEIDKSVTIQAANFKFIEIPIFAIKERRFKKYGIGRVKIALQNRYSSINKFKDKIGKKNLLEKLKYFIDIEAITWDFCLFSYSKMKSYYRRARKIEKASNNAYHPFVLIGHSKEFLSPGSFERFLRFTDGKCKYQTLTDIVNTYNSLTSSHDKQLN
jgi:hypothetical protein